MNQVEGYVQEVIVYPGRRDMIVLKLMNCNMYFLKDGGNITVREENSKGFQIVKLQDLAGVLMVHKGSVKVLLSPEIELYGASRKAEFTLMKRDEEIEK